LHDPTGLLNVARLAAFTQIDAHQSLRRHSRTPTTST
jgi:hypothetical protein